MVIYMLVDLQIFVFACVTNVYYSIFKCKQLCSYIIVPILPLHGEAPCEIQLVLSVYRIY